MRATFVLAPAGAKRLIARGVLQDPDLKRALASGRVIIAGGTTNGYIAEELGLLDPESKPVYTAGVITGGVMCISPVEQRVAPICLENGQRVETPWETFLQQFGPDDVFLKGANALDAGYQAGILLGSPTGGTTGTALGVLAARGCHLILPVGHEKMIPSCEEAAEWMGIDRIDESLGMRCGFLAVPYGRVFTEIEALHLLFGVRSRVVAAGGIGGSEGSVMFAVEGEAGAVERTVDAVRNLIKEKPLTGRKTRCADCLVPCSFRMRRR
ncbi:MAG: hypothetical protein ACM3QZ_09260 [Solirubrobacterales bacterium]